MCSGSMLNMNPPAPSTRSMENHATGTPTSVDARLAIATGLSIDRYGCPNDEESNAASPATTGKKASHCTGQDSASMGMPALALAVIETVNKPKNKRVYRIIRLMSSANSYDGYIGGA